MTTTPKKGDLAILARAVARTNAGLGRKDGEPQAKGRKKTAALAAAVEATNGRRGLRS